MAESASFLYKSPLPPFFKGGSYPDPGPWTLNPAPWGYRNLKILCLNASIRPLFSVRA